MRLLRPTSARQLEFGLTILRVVTGVVFTAHGAQKLFVWGFGGVTAGFAQMGIPLPGITGPAVALVEFFGGLALIVGLLTRFAAVGLVTTMLGALVLVYAGAGFFLPNGSEFVVTLLGASIAVAVAGAGAWSIDARLAGGRSAAGEARGAMRHAA